MGDVMKVTLTAEQAHAVLTLIEDAGARGAEILQAGIFAAPVGRTGWIDVRIGHTMTILDNAGNDVTTALDTMGG